MKRVPILKDPEFYFILFYNSMIIWLYLSDKVEPAFVIWAYYLQSVFLGVQFVVQSTMDTVRVSGSFFPLKQHSLTGFFMVHYGGFHFVYFIFLVVMAADLGIDQFMALISYVKYTALFLAINLALYTVREFMPSMPNKSRPSIFTAYLRILPIHLVIILGFNKSDFIVDAFIIFMILKFVGDFVMYRLTGGEYVEEVKA